MKLYINVTKMKYSKIFFSKFQARKTYYNTYIYKIISIKFIASFTMYICLTLYINIPFAHYRLIQLISSKIFFVLYYL